jgi:hypothetical protein
MLASPSIDFIDQQGESNMKCKLTQFLSFFAGIVVLASSIASAELPQSFDKKQIEFNVLKKFISLQSERDDFYRITDTQITEIEDNVVHKPGYQIQINYETPSCKNNYFKGVAYSVNCDDIECPFGMIYKKCF